MNKDQRDPLLDAKQKLNQYIIEHLKLPMKRGSYFQCPTGKHKDEDASCRIYPTNPLVCHCFGCNSSFDVFQLAHYVENLPQSGPEFWQVTVPHVYKALGMSYTPTEMDDETKELYKMYRAYEDAMNIICIYPRNPDALIYTYLAKRGWKLETAQFMGIGTVVSNENFLEKMYEKGWDNQYLEYAGLTSSQLFNVNNILFTIKNDMGKPVGFAARDTTWTKEDKGVKPKYLNSATSPIYLKGNILYNLDDAKSHTPPLWIVEGYGDVLNMIQNGIRNVCSPGSTQFTDGAYSSHIDLLTKYNINDIILAFDADAGGIEATDRTLDIFSKYPNFDISVCVIPESMDPDDYITKYGITKFKELPLLTPFDYKLTQFEHDDDTEKIAKDMIKYIGNERSPINQHKMISSLSKRTGVPPDVIQKEVDVINGNKDFQKYEEYRTISENILKEVKRTKNITSLYEVIDSHHKNLIEKIDMNDNSIPDIEHYRNRLLELRKECSEPQVCGFSTGKFKELEKYIDGMPKGASMIGMAGVANIGKSSFVRALTMEMVKNNPDILVIVMSTDDSFKKVIPGYIAIETGLTIGEIRKAGNRLINDEYKRQLYVQGWQKIIDLSDRLVVKDISDGGTTIALEKYIKYYKRMFPQKKLFAVVDNFHKLRDEYGNSDSRLKFTHISERIKELTVKYDMPILNVMELRKFTQFNDRPTLQDIKETVDIEYDCDLIWLMHQEMHIKYNTDYFWKLRDSSVSIGWRAMPFVELQFAKNKESGYKGTMNFRFRTDRSEFFEASELELSKRGSQSEQIYDDSFGKERVLNYMPQQSIEKIIDIPKIDNTIEPIKEVIKTNIIRPKIKEIITDW